MKLRTLLLVFACTLFAAGRPLASEDSLDRWAEAFAADWARTNPQFATMTQYFDGAQQDAIDRQLSLSNQFGDTFGRKAAMEQAALAKRGLDELARFDPASLTPDQRTSAAIIRWKLEDATTLAQFAPERFVFQQLSGYHLAVVQFLTTVHPIRNTRDIENYLTRLGLVGARIDEAIGEARAAAGAGIIPPRFVIERVLDQVDGFVKGAPAENVLVKSLDQRIATLAASVTADQRAQFVSAAEEETRESVLPAYGRVRTMLREQLAHATDDAGVWRLARGAEAYRAFLASETTTHLSADEIHAIGLREVARIEGEMDQILEQLGYADGSVKDRYEKLSASLPMPGGPDPRPALVAKVDALVQDAAHRSEASFDLRPKAPVTVRREPEFSEKSAAAHYTTPAPDGTIPGIYWLPLADLSPKVTWIGPGLKSTAYHEAIPGHHFQLTIQQESRDLPHYRRSGIFGNSSAYIEGWALYAERLADENGWYEGDAVGRLGYLQLQLFRARRLVVDTGLHSMKWTREQVIDYGFTAAEAERYVVTPGQACSYMIGQLRILELREKAKKALGSRFAIKDFHNVVLRGGSMPLDVLEIQIDDWIAHVLHEGAT